MNETNFLQSVRKMILDLPLLSVLGFPLLILIVTCWKIKCGSSTSKLPPGPPKLPLIGNLHQLRGPLLHHTLASLAKKHGPIMHLQLGQLSAVVITSSEIAKQILQTKEIHFAQRPQIFASTITSSDNSSLVNAPYGDSGDRFEKSVFDLLSANRVKSFRSIREVEVWDLVETISGQADGNVVVNLSPMIFSFTSNVTSRAAFGFKRSQLHQEEEFMLLLEQLTDTVGWYTNILAELYPSIWFIFRYVTRIKPTLERINKKLTKIFDDIIKKHDEDDKEKESGQRTILDVLVQLQNQSKSNHGGLQISNNHLKSITMDIYSAGSETTATTLEWAMSELVKNPRVMEKARAEVRETFKGKTRIEETDIENLSYLKLVVKETLRLRPPAVLLPREASETCEMGGYEVTVGTKILVNVWALGRDPDQWIEPDVFNPERFLDSSCVVDFKGTDYDFLPFGAGRRICPGISFATANIELALAQLLYHFDWTLPRGIKPEDFDMTEALGILTRRKLNLELIPTTVATFRKCQL